MEAAVLHDRMAVPSDLPAETRIPPIARVFDVAVVLLSLPVVVPLATLVGIAVFLDSPGPILYRARRIGRGGRPFRMLKFRTMVRDAGGPPVTASDDERHTPLGRSLARSRLDELPQLWNVLRGQMRLVGPRPEDEDFVGDFPEAYARILAVAPGLTGPAQVEYAWEGEVLARAQAVDRARVYRESILPLKLAIDIGYAEGHTRRGDLVLLARTVLLPGVRGYRAVRGALAGEGAATRVPVALAGVLLVSVLVLAGLMAAESATPF
jgi:lipopolysaccharide/colanic/teichoic acid biosynthesis glycosyltransferase